MHPLNPLKFLPSLLTAPIRQSARRPLRGGAFFLAMAALAAPAFAQPGQTYVPPPRRDREREREAPPRDRKQEGRELFTPGSPNRQRNEAEQQQSSWSIVLLAFRGETQQQDAMRGLATVQAEAGLANAYVEKRGEATVVAFGGYLDPQQTEAQADLKRIRAIEIAVDGSTDRPFENAFLTPPSDIRGTIPEYDLRNARATHGEWAIYTLQIGVYRREDGKPTTAAQIAEFRKLAEEAVLQLRREGEQAFYFHGPASSTVTISLFGSEDFDPQIRLESPQLRALRQRYPHNLLNGMGIRRRVTVTDQQGRPVQTERLDPSMLVAVPRSDR